MVVEEVDGFSGKEKKTSIVGRGTTWGKQIIETCTSNYYIPPDEDCFYKCILMYLTKNCISIPNIL